MLKSSSHLDDILQSAYNPYSVAYGQKNQWQQPAYTEEYRQASTLTSIQERLDKMTRSRNALIIALAVFVIAFLVCFVFLMIKMPDLIPVSNPTDESIQVISIRTDLDYDTQLEDSTSYAYNLMNTTMCTQITDAAKAAGTILECNAIQFAAATTGTKGTIVLKVALDGKTETERFQMVSDAIVTAASADTNWIVNEADVTRM